MAPRWIAGYDFSPCADAALAAAAHELGPVGGTLVIVHAYREPHKSLGFELAVSSPAFDPLEDLDRLISEALHTRLEEVASRLRASSPGLVVETRAVKGHASEQIVALADALEVDRIVMGTHGHRGLKKFFLGSVAERVLKLSHRPVLVVKPGGEHGDEP